MAVSESKQRNDDVKGTVDTIDDPVVQKSSNRKLQFRRGLASLSSADQAAAVSPSSGEQEPVQMQSPLAIIQMVQQMTDGLRQRPPESPQTEAVQKKEEAVQFTNPPANSSASSGKSKTDVLKTMKKELPVAAKTRGDQAGKNWWSVEVSKAEIKRKNGSADNDGWTFDKLYGAAGKTLSEDAKKDAEAYAKKSSIHEKLYTSYGFEGSDKDAGPSWASTAVSAKDGKGIRDDLLDHIGGRSASKMISAATSAMASEPAEVPDSVKKIKYDKSGGTYGKFGLKAPSKPEHNEWFPGPIQTTSEDNGITIQTFGYKGATFTITLDEKMVSQAKGKSLKVKDTVGLAGLRGKTKAWKISNIVGYFNSAHLIPDKLMGSGHKEAQNTVATSPTFNQVEMVKYENQVYKYIGASMTDYETQYKAKLEAASGDEDLLNPSQITYDLTVDVDWAEFLCEKMLKAVVDDPKIKQELQKTVPYRYEKSFQEYVREKLQLFFTLNKTEHGELKRVKAINYKVEINGQPIKSYSSPFGPTSSDKWLGLFDKPLR